MSAVAWKQAPPGRMGEPPRDEDHRRERGPAGRLAAQVAALQQRVAQLEERAPAGAQAPDRMSIMAFSGDLDRVYTALTLATSAASMGCDVRIFFSFWATAALRRRDDGRTRPWVDRVLGWLMPTGPSELRLSRMDLCGLGTALMRRRMRALRLADLDELLVMAGVAGVRILVCETSLALLGITRADLIDYPRLDLCGAASFVAGSLESRTTLFL